MESTQNYINITPLEIIEIIISYLDHDSLENIIEVINFDLSGIRPVEEKLNWTRINYYRFNNYNINNYKEYYRYLAIIKLINDLNLLESLFTKKPTSYQEIINSEHLTLAEKHIKYLPKEISLLENMKSLDLYKNELESIDVNILSKLPKLVTLNMSANKITEIPQDIDKLKHLKRLILFKNNITSTELDVNQNKIIISDIPSRILKAKHLKIDISQQFKI